jgi:two-component system response regulator FixJ
MKGPVAIVDDDEAVCDALTALLEASGYATLVFMSLAAFRAALAAFPPAVLLLDVKLPDGSGVDVLPEILSSTPNLAVIMMTGHGDVSLAVAAMKAGARDFLEKPFEPRELLGAVDRSLASSELNMARNEAERAARERLATLTPREREVLASIVEGASSKEIARRLALSPRTIETHRARVMSKTGAGSLSTLVRLAILAGFQGDGDP